MNADQVRLHEVQAELELEKRKLLQLGQTGFIKAKDSLGVLEAFRENPLEAALLAVCGVMVATKVFKNTQKP